MTSVFCLHLHNQRGVGGGGGGVDTGRLLPAVAFVWVLPCWSRQTAEHLMKRSQVGTNGAEENL